MLNHFSPTHHTPLLCLARPERSYGSFQVGSRILPPGALIVSSCSGGHPWPERRGFSHVVPTLETLDAPLSCPSFGTIAAQPPGATLPTYVSTTAWSLKMRSDAVWRWAMRSWLLSPGSQNPVLQSAVAFIVPRSQQPAQWPPL